MRSPKIQQRKRQDHQLGNSEGQGPRRPHRGKESICVRYEGCKRRRQEFPEGKGRHRAKYSREMTWGEDPEEKALRLIIRSWPWLWRQWQGQKPNSSGYRQESEEA